MSKTILYKGLDGKLVKEGKMVSESVVVQTEVSDPHVPGQDPRLPRPSPSPNESEMVEPEHLFDPPIVYGLHIISFPSLGLLRRPVT